MVESTVGAVWIQNYGVMIGTINVTGANDYQYWNGDGYSTDTAYDEVDNYAAWFTQGLNTVGPEGTGVINNDGLIQTAFGDVSPTSTTFDVGAFYNDDPTYNGYLSSLDGVSGNTTTITGDFYGSPDESEALSYVALDANLTTADDVPAPGDADRLVIEGSAYGTTGLIVNNVNTTNSFVINTDGILVAQVNSPDGDGCYNTACADGDTFYISNATPNYVSVNGTGAIQEGLYAWYLTEITGGPGIQEGEDGYYLETAALPTAYQLPEITTGLTNIFYSSAGLVADHMYGRHFPGAGGGGGGADATTDSQTKADSAVWATASGSWSDQNSSVDSSIFGTFDTSFNQSVYTLLGGVDMAPNGGNSGFRFGAFGGYVQSNMNFDGYGTTAKYTGGKVGGYAAYTQGGFYMDAQVDADFTSVAFNAPLGGGVTIDTKGTTIGVLANVGDRMYSGMNFIEPLASFAYANMSLGDQNVSGASVSFSNGESLRGGIGGRIGTTMKGKDGVLTEVSLLGRLWNEFSGNNTVTITDGISTDTFTNDTSGLYGEVTGTLSVADPKTNLSTFVSGGAMFGSDSTTWDARAGVRKDF